MNIRNPAVAGAFYPFSKEDVQEQLKELFGYWGIKSLPKKRVECFGVVVPHAGWEYSGYVAARVFADMPKVDTVILMGPNHYGLGPDFSISSDDAWRTPLGGGLKLIPNWPKRWKALGREKKPLTLENTL